MQPMSSPITLPLAKYSRAADVPKDVAQFEWSHITGNLVIVLDSFRGANAGRSTPSPQMLKVLQGTQILEVVPVEEMIAETNKVISTLQQLRVQIRNEQLPISALVRSPLLAIRYNLPDTDKVRRIQLRFQSGADFNTVHDHVQRLGLRMAASEAQRRPSTAQPMSRLVSTKSSGPSCPPSRLAEVANRPLTAYSSGALHNAPKVSSPLARHSFSTSSSSSLEEASCVPARPASALALSNMSPPHHPTGSVFPHPLNPPEYFARPVSSSSILDHPSTSTSAERNTLSILPTIEENASSANTRPSSATLSSSRKTSDAFLPPRRELPFPRPTPPKSSGSDSTRPPSRAGAMAPLQRGEFSHSNNRSIVIEDDIHPLRPAFSVDAEKQPRPSSSSSRLHSRDTVLLPLPEPTFVGKAAKETRANSSAATFEDAMADVQPTAPPLPKLSRTEQNTFPSSSSAILPSPPQSEATYQDRILSEIAKAAGNNVNNVLGSYASQSEEDRTAMLNDFMIQHIDDDSFITLVEDVSVCWATIGLGLQ